jgi:hypothetical protein
MNTVPDIPWNTPEIWREANQSLGRLIACHQPVLQPIVHTAIEIRNRLTHIFPVVDTVCAATCTHCPEPCCLSAKIWFDFKDLLFIHLTGQMLPPAQPLADGAGICRYAGPRGCRLPRLSRPWICSWYLCPPQKRSGPGVEMKIALAAIQTARKQLEDQFITMIS